MELQKQFVPKFNIVKKLEQLGFNEECLATIDQTDYVHVKGTKKLPRGSMMYDVINCPLYSQSFDWFREKYNLCTQDFIDLDNKFTKNIVKILKSGQQFTYIEYYETYQEAQLECLNKLIEIVEQQNK